MPVPLKDSLFGPDRFTEFANHLNALFEGFDRKRFLRLALADLDQLTLMQRVGRMSEVLGRTLPADYRHSLRILRELAPRMGSSFSAIVLPEFVARHGLDDFDTSMDALKFFTRFGSSEFAVREFLRKDQKRALEIMETWSRDPDEHVRRLASEGTRPRLPWSFRLVALQENPDPVAAILDNLKADPSLYVRKSVANHLNDIAKDHPQWVLDRLALWTMEHAATAWIAKRALRTLIKQGNRAALAHVGSGEQPRVTVSDFRVSPRRVALGESVRVSVSLTSRARKPQRLTVDYAVHYRKSRGHAAPKVFKWRELVLAPLQTVALSKSQTIRDFTTRKHHPGHHAVDLLINGVRWQGAGFVIAPA